jgi:hypothetical protein
LPLRMAERPVGHRVSARGRPAGVGRRPDGWQQPCGWQHPFGRRDTALWP